MALLANGEGQRRFFRRNLILHTHIEKSAGSSLVAAFADLFGAARVHDLRPAGAMQPRDIGCREKARLWLLTGHFHYGSMDALFARRKVYIATVRDPVTRFVSSYHYVRASPDHPAFLAIRGKNLEQLIAELIARGHPLVTNDMSRSLGITRPEEIAAQIEKNYAIVAPFARVDELIAALYRIFGQCEGPKIRLNMGPQEAVALAPEIQRLFLSYNQIDTALCNYVERRFDAWLNDLEDRLCRSQRREAAQGFTMHRLGQWWNGGSGSVHGGGGNSAWAGGGHRTSALRWICV
jgi:hypothetical protein